MAKSVSAGDEDAAQDEDENDDGDEDISDTEEADAKMEAPVKRRRMMSKPDLSDAEKKPTPLLIVHLGAGNGNNGLGFLPVAFENPHLHCLILEPNAQCAEFATRRISAEVYRSWFAGSLRHGSTPLAAPTLLRKQDLVEFDPSPLALQDGRLVLPENLLKKFERFTVTCEAAKSLKESHAREFHEGDCCMTKACRLERISVNVSQLQPFFFLGLCQTFVSFSRLESI